MRRFNESNSVDKYPRELADSEQEMLFRKCHYLVNIIVNRIARRLPKKFATGKYQEDLREAGEMGFAEALQNFFVLNADRYADENLEDNFKKYALIVIYGRIRDHQRQTDSLSRTARKYADAITKAKGELIEKHSTPAGPTWTEFSDEEIAELLNLAPEEYKRWMHIIKNSRQQRSTPVMVELDESNLERKLPGQYLTPEQIAITEQTRRFLDSALTEGQLTEKEAQLIKAKYFEGEESAIIQKTLEIPPTEIKNVETAALAKLKDYFQKRGLSFDKFIKI